MSVVEYASWVEYALVEPFGPYFEDLRHAQVVAAIYNVNRDQKVQREPYPASGFARWNGLHRRSVVPEKPLFVDDAEAQSKAILAAFGFAE